MSTPLKKISIHSSGEQARTQCERTSIFGHFVGIWGSQCNSCFLLVGIWGTQTQTKINPGYYQFCKNLQLQLQEWWVNVWKTQLRIRSSLNICFGISLLGACNPTSGGAPAWWSKDRSWHRKQALRHQRASWKELSWGNGDLYNWL